MEISILKAFTHEDKGGNKAGVALIDKQITNEEKQKIAAKVNLSETAFILQLDDNNFDVSFFTPLTEVDLCGHATIAAFYYLGLIGIINGVNENKKVYQHTKAGKLEIDLFFKEKIDYVLMQQNKPKIYDELLGENLKSIAYSLNLKEDDIGLINYSIFPTIASTGLRDIMVPVKSRDILNSMRVSLKKIDEISKDKDVIGYHVYTIEKDKIYARNFAPKVGIDEECATGTSNGALCSLLYSKKIISNNAQVIQGEAMNEKSIIYVQIIDDNGIDVRVGGKASIETSIYV